MRQKCTMYKKENIKKENIKKEENINKDIGLSQRCDRNAQCTRKKTYKKENIKKENIN